MTAVAGSAAPRAAGPAPGTPSARRPLPAWPVDVLLWGFPVSWALGLTPVIVPLVALVMLALLLVRVRLRVVRGVAPLLAFAAWLVPCALMIDSGLRLVGYAQRVGNYVAIAVVLVYLVNAAERLTARRVVGGLAAVWFTVVLGGYLGVLLPDVRLTTPMGLLLPDALTGNDYVRDLVFPPLAEVQQPYGAAQPYNRPSAPFAYTNSWGAAFALLTPVALAQLAMSRSRRTKVLLAVALAASLVPAAATLNRGMFVGLAVGVCYVALRLGLRGRVVPFVALATGAVAAGAVAVSTGLLGALTERAAYGSTSDRALLYRETFDRVLHSPLFGYGAPRPSGLVDVSVGTQGFVWFLMFSFGFVGLGLFLWFLLGGLARTWRAPGTPALWLHGVLVTACSMIAFYGLGTMQLLCLVLVVGVLLRHRGGVLAPEAAP